MQVRDSNSWFPVSFGYNLIFELKTQECFQGYRTDEGFVGEGKDCPIGGDALDSYETRGLVESSGEIPIWKRPSELLPGVSEQTGLSIPALGEAVTY